MQSILLFVAQAAPEGRVFGLDTQTLISVGIQLLNGIILAVALSKILYKSAKEFMQKRTERIKSKLDNADEIMAKANKLIAEYEQKLREVDKERLAILESARNKATEESKKILDEASKEAYEIRKRSLEAIEEDKKRLKEEARLQIIELATFIAEKYIKQKIDEETQNMLFEEAIKKLEDSLWQN